MRSLFITAIVLVFPVIAVSATIHVPPDQPTIQAGIDVAVGGDTVLVAPGTYVENIDFKGKAITVTSEQGADVTVIDGGKPIDPDYGSCVLFMKGEGPDSVIEGFTLTSGTGTDFYGYGSFDGGGIGCDNSSPSITSNIITENTADENGGGIYCKSNSSPIITNNIILGNWSDWYGGGIYCQSNSSPTITNNVITGNSANASAGGGGIYCSYNSSPTITNNFISKNSAADCGGGINSWESSSTITNNTITGNTAGHNGGGIYCNSSSSTITNNTISGNSAEKGGGIGCSHGSSSTLSNNILWNNAASSGPEIYIGDQSTVIISYSDVKGGQASVYVEPSCTLNWGSGMIVTNPLFVDADDFHLTWYSPCKDTGDNSAVTEIFDFEGDPRIAYGTVDMGADEFYTHLYFTGEATPGGYVEVKIIGIPGSTPVTMWAGSGVLDPYWPTQYGHWYLQLPIVTLRVFYEIPYDGLILLPANIPPDYPPWDIPLQTLVGDQLTNLCVMYVRESPPSPPPGMVKIPAGEFEMGDHFGIGWYDELPVHAVYVDSFYMDFYEVTNQQYCNYLNSAYGQGLIEVKGGVVYKKGDWDPYCNTYSYDDDSRIHWHVSTETFSVTPGKEDHPMVEVSWYGAVAYANWCSAQDGLNPCYDLDTWKCTFGAGGYRLPTEAEWEYAARGGEHNPYYKYPWGDIIDGSKANFENSGDPFEGTIPETAPVGYYDGNQTPSGVDMANGYDLYDMAGNVYEWCNDWYDDNYYNSSPYNNPKGPSNGITRVHSCPKSDFSRVF